MLGLDELSVEDRRTVARARRLQRFLTQPFIVTAAFTGREGKIRVRRGHHPRLRRHPLRGLRRWPEAIFYMTGTIDDVRARKETS